MEFIDKSKKEERVYEIIFDREKLKLILDEIVKYTSYRVSGEFRSPDRIKFEGHNIIKGASLPNGEPMFQDITRIWWGGDAHYIKGVKIIPPKLATIIEGILNGHEGSFRAFIKYETEYELISIDEKIAAAKLDAEMIDESKPDAKIKALKRIEKLYLEKRDNRYFNTDLLKDYYNLARSLFKLHLVKETVEKDDYIEMDDYRPVKK